LAFELDLLGVVRSVEAVFHVVVLWASLSSLGLGALWLSLCHAVLEQLDYADPE
jgi:hypothetical protein